MESSKVGSNEGILEESEEGATCKTSKQAVEPYGRTQGILSPFPNRKQRLAMYNGLSIRKGRKLLRKDQANYVVTQDHQGSRI